MANVYKSKFADAQALGIDQIVFDTWRQSTIASPENFDLYRKDWEKGLISLIVDADQLWPKVSEKMNVQIIKIEKL